jgi:hypothetical protein
MTNRIPSWSLLLISALAGCSDASGDDSSGGGSARVEVADKEPNGGPDGMGAQSIGSVASDTVFAITGSLSSGGNDGQTYTGDYDLFALEVTQPGSLALDVSWDNDADVDTVIYDATTLMAVAADGGTTKPARANVASAKGKYMVALLAKDKGASYTATLTYQAASTGTGGGGTCMPMPAFPAAATGGCSLKVVTPACANADLTGGMVFELDYTTNMTFCEAPHHLAIGGDPPSSWAMGNAITFDLSSQDGGGHNPDERYGMTRNSGGYFRINAQDFTKLTSASGVYYWGVTSFHGSRSEIMPIVVKK